MVLNSILGGALSRLVSPSDLRAILRYGGKDGFHFRMYSGFNSCPVTTTVSFRLTWTVEAKNEKKLFCIRLLDPGMFDKNFPVTNSQF